MLATYQTIPGTEDRAIKKRQKFLACRDYTPVQREAINKQTKTGDPVSRRAERIVFYTGG